MQLLTQTAITHTQGWPVNMSKEGGETEAPNSLHPAVIHKETVCRAPGLYLLPYNTKELWDLG
jgi:hypothetical protein